MVKHIPFIEMPAGAELSEPLPDGRYAQINYFGGPVGLAKVPDPFPWKVMIFGFNKGEGYLVASGSDPGYMIRKYGASKAFLVGIDKTRHTELNEKLAKEGLALATA